MQPGYSRTWVLSLLPLRNAMLVAYCPSLLAADASIQALNKPLEAVTALLHRSQGRNSPSTSISRLKEPSYIDSRLRLCYHVDVPVTVGAHGQILTRGGVTYGVLSAEEDKQALLDMIVLGHPEYDRKLTPPPEHIVVSMHPQHKTNCFMLVRVHCLVLLP
eukprot:1703625-Pyramimonas_sp.AAC.2